jgi:hypothetical protein
MMKKVKMLFGVMCCFVAFCFLLSFTGCGAANSMARTMSSGQVGCPPDSIIIENLVNGLVTNSWIAKCEGRTYYCSQTADGPAYCKEKKMESSKDKK